MTSPTPSHAGQISIEQTLALLDGPFSEMADGVAQDLYAFWLGSGISFNRMPKLAALVEVVLDYLQAHASADPACPMRKSLVSILGLAGVSGADLANIDFEKPAKAWPGISAIVDRLVLLYSRMLDAAPDNEEPDFLVWDALDVVGVYGDAKIEPDAEHFAIAALVMEGVASDIPSANWDGLVEKAVDRLSAGAPILRVWVRGEDGRAPARKADLYKFHGCAVKAGEDQDVYRERIVGRQSQIVGWVGRSENAVLAAKLTDIAANKRTLMLGLSAQDANIQGIFVAAEQRMLWDWPSHPPAYVFSENELGVDQQVLLQNVYRSAYTGASKGQIYQAALLRAYAKPLLAALWLHVIGSKLSALLDFAPGSLSAADRLQLRTGLIALRDRAASAAGGVSIEEFVLGAFGRSQRVLSLFREGKLPTSAAAYRALTNGPVQSLTTDATLSTSGLAEFSVALGLIGLITQSGAVMLATSDLANIDAPALEAHGASGTKPIYFAANAQAALHLFDGGRVAESHDAILVHAHALPSRMARSPRPARGRTGKAMLREASVTELLSTSPNASELLQKFRDKVSL